MAEKNSVWRLRRQVLEDAADVGQKAHVEHAVRLVEDEDLDALQARIRVLEVVEEPARRRDDDVGASAERGLLRPHADTAIHRGAAQPREAGEVPAVLVDLRGELPRGRDDERARDAARLAVEVLQDRQQECRRLAAARHGAGEDVPALASRAGIASFWIGVGTAKPI